MAMNSLITDNHQKLQMTTTSIRICNNILVIFSKTVLNNINIVVFFKLLIDYLADCNKVKQLK